jgi:long-subunit acyl-CoA synthetase (AMP-forming)
LYFVESLDTFLDNLQTAKVTTFFSVPRLWHKFKDTVLEKMPQSKLDTLLSIPIIGRIVSKVIRRKLGLQHARAFGSGTAPIDKPTLRWYKDIGIPISEGWGLTESAAASTCNLPYSPEAMGTIGKALEGSVIKIADNGELMLKGPSIFTRYHKNPEATAEAFTNGWFHTGDLGEFDSRGNIKIIGRIKDQFKTTRGKYVSPVRLESLLAANPALDLVCVSGSHRSQPVALVVLKEGLSQNLQLEKELSNSLQLCNAKLEIHERIAHLLICPEPWTPENGLLTPTLKIRRFQIEQHYQRQLAENFTRPIVWL